MDNQKEQILNEYVKFRMLGNHSKNILNIEYQIKEFLNSTNKPLDEFDDKILLDYLTKISSKYSTVTLNIIKSSHIKNFLKWYFPDRSLRFRHLDKICKMEKYPSPYQPEDMITVEDFKKLILGEDSQFWKCYFLTLFYGGCRPIEVCNLTWDKVEFDGEDTYITIYSKKNKTEYTKSVGPKDASLNTYLKKLKDNNSKYVFENENTKKPITVKGAYYRIGKLSERVLGRKIDLYTLRHSIATILYNKNNIKDDDIARQMGHSKSMKEKYVHNDKKRLKEIAKSIYSDIEDLPPEKKHKLEKELEEIKNELEEVKNENEKHKIEQKKVNLMVKVILKNLKDNRKSISR